MSLAGSNLSCWARWGLAAAMAGALAAPLLKADEKAAPPKPAVPAEFRVGPGDVMRVDVWKEPEVSADVIVRPDGRVSLPLVKELDVNGMTPTEIQKAVTERLSKFLASPDVTVVIRQIQSKKVYLIGKIGRVGPLLLLSSMTLAQAISEAGGPTEYANTKKILLIRAEEGKLARYEFNYKSFLKGEVKNNLELKPGDTIVVP
jgi:polysaccharide export outer membrane protein